MLNQNSRRLGVITSIIAALFTALFGIFIVLDNKMVYFIVCLFLSWNVVMMFISMRVYIGQGKKVLIDCAIAFSVIYAALVSLVYYTQISSVLLKTFSTDQLAIISDAPGMVFFFIDMLGYCFLTLATLFVALTVEWNYRPLRIFLFIHSAIFIPTFIIPFLPLSFSTNEASGNVSGALVLVFWCIIFIPVCALLTNYFIRQKDSVERSNY